MAGAGDPLRDHVAMLHELAAGIDGKLTVASYGQNPDTGEDTGARVLHFRIGDVDGMVAAIRKLGAERHRNIYSPLSVVRADLPDGKRGTKADVVAVLGLCGDFDDEDAGNYPARLPLPANYVIETSARRFQAFYLFAKPIDPAAADAVAVRLKAHAKCDHGTADFSHVWRLPDTLNWPNQKKVAEGRKTEPQSVRVAEAWDGTLTDFDALAAALPAHEPKPQAPAVESTGEGINFDELPEDLRKLIVEGAPIGDRSDQFYHVVAELKERDAGVDAIEALLAAHPGGIAAKFIGRLRPEIERCFNKAEGRRQAKDDFQAERPTIKIVAGALHDLATQAETALIKAGAPLYVRGPRIVRPVVEDADAAHGRKTKVARLSEVTADALIDRLSQSAHWTRYDVRSEKDVAANPPRQVAATILSRDGEWRLRRLAGVITTPTLRPDGSLLTAPGYDPQTRLLLIDPPAMPDIPAHPTRADAAAALNLLYGLFRECPFTDGASRAVALSGAISAVVRGALPAVPLHAFRAPSPGSSKSFTVDITAMIATGQRAPVISAGQSVEELEKRLGAAVMTGQPLISIDNLNGHLEGDALCQLIERPVVDVRILGRSEQVRIENRATLFATGNNLIACGDLVRRVLVANLDANSEKPELRQFKGDPLSEVAANRGRYVAACLTIVRAYIQAGHPDPQPSLASFEQWSLLVRSALMWLGCADPVSTIEASREEDPEAITLHQVVAAWRDSIGILPAISQPSAKEWRTAGKLAEEAQSSSDPAVALRDALRSIAGIHRHGFESVDARILGKWLSARKGRIAQGLKIVSHFDSKAKQQKWALMSVAGIAGIGGDVSSHRNKSVSENETDSDRNIVRAEKIPANTRNTRQLSSEENHVDIFS